MNGKPKIDEGVRVLGPFPLWTIVVSQPKDPDTARKSMIPDPRKATAQAPEMIVRTKIHLLPQNKDGTLRTEKEAEQIFRRFVQKNRHRYPDDHSFSLEQNVDFWTMEGEGTPELGEFCPDHPGQKENFCGYCGKPAATTLKTS
ncbi:hypothetical protein KKD80_03170 [Patescibacteria group bacterium]|nr:hypothetical protein [Patescibacteria group bacterium]